MFINMLQEKFKSISYYYRNKIKFCLLYIKKWRHFNPENFISNHLRLANLEINADCFVINAAFKPVKCAD